MCRAPPVGGRAEGGLELGTVFRSTRSSWSINLGPNGDPQLGEAPLANRRLPARSAWKSRPDVS